MSTKWWEKPDSRQSTENPRKITLKFGLSGSTDDVFVRAYAKASTPILCDGLYRQDLTVDPAGFKLWDVAVPYAPISFKQPEIGEFKFQWETTGGTAKITQAKERIAEHGVGGVPPDTKGAIGVTEDGQVEGCEIVIPVFKWTETHQLSSAFADWDYSQILKAITGRVNDDNFRGFPLGQVRFDGAVGGGSNKDPEIVEVTFHFAQQDDALNVTVGEMTEIDKHGWEYSHVLYLTMEDKKNVKQPRAVYIDRVYDAADFSLLGIGT
jgi:hypothetical protein